MSTTTTIQLAPAPSRLTVQCSIESVLYSHVSECATEVSESRPPTAVSHSLLEILKTPNVVGAESKRQFTSAESANYSTSC